MTKIRKEFLAIPFLVPVPSIATFLAMHLYPESSFIKVLFGIAKLWVFLLPAIWYLKVSNQKISLSPLKKEGGILFGMLSGIVISIIIFLFYYYLSDLLIDKKVFREQLYKIGFDSKVFFLSAAAYWILINSVLEEYVWRWFVTVQCEQLVSRYLAIILSALFFTLHHIVATSVYFSFAGVAVCSIGVFTGGLIWSWMYLKYQSIWPGYISHALVDLCIFAIAYNLLFA